MSARAGNEGRGASAAPGEKRGQRPPDLDWDVRAAKSQAKGGGGWNGNGNPGRGGGAAGGAGGGAGGGAAAMMNPLLAEMFREWEATAVDFCAAEEVAAGGGQVWAESRNPPRASSPRRHPPEGAIPASPAAALDRLLSAEITGRLGSESPQRLQDRGEALLESALTPRLFSFPPLRLSFPTSSLLISAPLQRGSRRADSDSLLLAGWHIYP